MDELPALRKDLMQEFSLGVVALSKKIGLDPIEVDEVTLFVRLIPSETGTDDKKLGDSDRPVVYCISVAADRIVTQCHPIGSMIPIRHGAGCPQGREP